MPDLAIAPPRPYASLTDRIRANVRLCDVFSSDLDSPCWLWQGRINNVGYGTLTMRVPGRPHPVPQLVHRLSYQLHKGEIAPGFEIDHLCCIKHCCNPDHLELVEGLDNLQRRTARRKQSLQKVASASAL